MNMVFTIWVPYKAGNFLTSSAIKSLSTRDHLQAVAAPSLLRQMKSNPTNTAKQKQVSSFYE
jgi:hypothetical protein